MKATRFRHLLIDACLVASAVDGDVDDSELAVIREAMTKTFVGEDAVHERIEQLDDTAVSFCDNIDQRRSACVEELRGETLTKGQLRRLIDLCCRVVGADGVFDSSEVNLLRTIITACGITVAEAPPLCPEHAGVLRLLADDVGSGFTASEPETPPDITDLGK